jgi:hypothetical protein
MPGPDEKARKEFKTELYGEATNLKGDKVIGGVSCCEPYRFTAIATCYILNRMLEAKLPSGVWNK